MASADSAPVANRRRVRKTLCGVWLLVTSSGREVSPKTLTAAERLGAKQIGGDTRSVGRYTDAAQTQLNSCRCVQRRRVWSSVITWLWSGAGHAKPDSHRTPAEVGFSWILLGMASVLLVNVKICCQHNRGRWFVRNTAFLVTVLWRTQESVNLPPTVFPSGLCLCLLQFLQLSRAFRPHISFTTGEMEVVRLCYCRLGEGEGKRLHFRIGSSISGLENTKTSRPAVVH